MSNKDNFAAVRRLCEDYYQQRISKEEYRNERTILLAEIDNDLNQVTKTDGNGSDTGFVDKILSIFKNKDEEKMT